MAVGGKMLIHFGCSDCLFGQWTKWYIMIPFIAGVVGILGIPIGWLIAGAAIWMGRRQAARLRQAKSPTS